MPALAVSLAGSVAGPATASAPRTGPWHGYSGSRPGRGDTVTLTVKRKGSGTRLTRVKSLVSVFCVGGGGGSTQSHQVFIPSIKVGAGGSFKGRYTVSSLGFVDYSGSIVGGSGVLKLDPNFQGCGGRTTFKLLAGR